MTDEQKASAIANISDILARNVCMKFEYVAQIIVTWLEEREEKENSEAKWYPCYIEDESNIVGIAGIRSGDLFSARKINSKEGDKAYIPSGLIITIGNGIEKTIFFDTPEQRDKFFDRIKKELL